jgi:hypothetical protein
VLHIRIANLWQLPNLLILIVKKEIYFPKEKIKYYTIIISISLKIFLKRKNLLYQKKRSGGTNSGKCRAESIKVPEFWFTYQMANKTSGIKHKIIIAGTGKLETKLNNLLKIKNQKSSLFSVAFKRCNLYYITPSTHILLTTSSSGKVLICNC